MGVGAGKSLDVTARRSLPQGIGRTRRVVERESRDGGRQAGSSLPHVPVMGPQAVDAACGGTAGAIIDGTFGAGGYTRLILDGHADRDVLAIDRDPSAIEAGQGLVGTSRGRLTLASGRFGDLDTIARETGLESVGGIVLDIGVSSMQLDQAQRGFSFRFEGPLDMRMSSQGESAADLVNRLAEGELADLIYRWGEERRSRAVARAIVAARSEAPITTTQALAAIVSRVVRSEPGAIHPATRTFQALRIAVNDELGELARALHAAERILAPGGRLAIVTFHSLEDRIVKTFLAQRTGRAPTASRHLPPSHVLPATFAPVGKGLIAPSEAEIAANPRARSAKLRVAERLPGPALPPERDTMALAASPLSPAPYRRR
jgi:16S rRNA (cytosine1402-N4)-methyltransferase